jgi:hypothetical protein
MGKSISEKEIQSVYKHACTIYKNGYKAALSNLILHYKKLYGKEVRKVPVSRVISYLEKELKKSDKVTGDLNLR